MGNCLKTQLKEVVQNDNLTKLGTIKLHVTPKTITDTLQQRLTVRAINGTIDVILPGPYYFGDTVADISTNTDTQYSSSGAAPTKYFKNAEYPIVIDPKYNLRWIKNGREENSIISVNINDLKYCTSLEQLQLDGSDSWGDIAALSSITSLAYLSIASTQITGNIASLSGLNLDQLLINTQGISGNISALANMTNLTTLSFGQYITGDIASLGKCTKLTTAFLGNTTIGGTVESFVNGQCTAAQNPRTATQTPLYINSLLLKATFGGRNFIDNVSYLSWESATKIAVMIGNSSNPTKVYYSGYTTSEAATKWPNVSSDNLIKVDA